MVRKKPPKKKAAPNLKQLQTCWQLYVDDNNGLVPPNESVFASGVWRSTPDSWIGSSMRTKTA